MYVPFNPNPRNKIIGDCAVRAICKVMNKSWDEAYLDLCAKGLELKDMPNANSVWGSYLRDHGFRREIIPNTCPDCYTIEDFCRDNPYGTFVIGTGTHAVAAINGRYFDTWQSGHESPAYVYRKEEY